MEQCRSRFHGDQCVREIGHTDRHRHRHGIGGILWADADEDRMYSESEVQAMCQALKDERDAALCLVRALSQGAGDGGGNDAS